MPEINKTNLCNEIANFQPALFKLALLQLREKAAAEDATQETLLAAIENHKTFEGRSSLRTWLIGILKYKILDIIRQRRKLGPSFDPTELEHELDISAFDPLFEQSGCWATAKDVWSDPIGQIERLEFFKILEACLTKLPANTSRVFLMREWLGFNTEDICREIGVTSANVRVLLYRARMQLRQCLDENWDRSS